MPTETDGWESRLKLYNNILDVSKLKMRTSEMVIYVKIELFCIENQHLITLKVYSILLLTELGFSFKILTIIKIF